jgi:hypothetical protein
MRVRRKFRNFQLNKKGYWAPKFIVYQYYTQEISSLGSKLTLTYSYIRTGNQTFLIHAAEFWGWPLLFLEIKAHVFIFFQGGPQNKRSRNWECDPILVLSPPGLGPNPVSSVVFAFLHLLSLSVIKEKIQMVGFHVLFCVNISQHWISYFFKEKFLTVWSLVYFFQISEEKPSKKTHKMQNEAGEYVDMYIPR